MRYNTEISILIPTINEEKNISLILNLIKKTFNKNIKKEIIFIDDNSIDKTIENIKTYQKKMKNIKLINSKKKLGLGHAINQGLKIASGKFILCLDCDCAVNNFDLKKIIEQRGLKKVVIGSRYLAKSKIINCNRAKIFLSKLVNIFIAFCYDIKGRDLTQSLRIFPRVKNFKPINLTHPAYFIELSIYLKKKIIIFMKYLLPIIIELPV